jgi:hypothetical protein
MVSPEVRILLLEKRITHLFGKKCMDCPQQTTGPEANTQEDLRTMTKALKMATVLAVKDAGINPDELAKKISCGYSNLFNLNEQRIDFGMCLKPERFLKKARELIFSKESS